MIPAAYATGRILSADTAALNAAAAYVDAAGANESLVNCHGANRALTLSSSPHSYGCNINESGGIQTRLCPGIRKEEERILAASPCEKLSSDVILSFPPR
jgi:hypothetical protein